MDRLNIVILNDFAHVNGGAGQTALAAARLLAERGHKVTVFAAVMPIMAELTGQNLTVVCLDQQEIAGDPLRFRAASQGIWNVRAGRALSAVLDQLGSQNTIVHVHGWTKALSSSVIRAAILKRANVVCTLNDYFAVCPNGSFLNYPKQKICTLKPLSVNCILENCDKRGYSHKLWRVLRQSIQSRWGLMPDGIRHFISVSEFSRQILTPFLPHNARVFLLKNPIDVAREDLAQVQRSSTYVMVGRLAKEKGAELFALAARRLGIDAMFVGDGECRTAITKLNPSARITGWCSRIDVISRMREARAVVFPSIWYEAHPLVVLEAAALGVPAIVSDTCASREDVIHEKTGLWCKAGDLDDLAKQMKSLQDNDRVAVMGRAAYEKYWSDPSTVQYHVDRLEEIYCQVLAS